MSRFAAFLGIDALTAAIDRLAAAHERAHPLPAPDEPVGIVALPPQTEILLAWLGAQAFPEMKRDYFRKAILIVTAVRELPSGANMGELRRQLLDEGAPLAG